MVEQGKDTDLSWEVAKKLSNLSDKEREKIFWHPDIGTIIKNNSAGSVYHKILEHEMKIESERINVGDIVKTNCLWNGIVVSIDNIDYTKEDEEVFYVIFDNGDTNTFTRKELTKTDKSVDILKVLSDLILE